MVLDRARGSAATAPLIDERAAAAVALPYLAPNGRGDRACAPRAFLIATTTAAAWSIGNRGFPLERVRKQQIKGPAHDDGRVGAGTLVAE